MHASADGIGSSVLTYLQHWLAQHDLPQLDPAVRADVARVLSLDADAVPQHLTEALKGGGLEQCQVRAILDATLDVSTWFLNDGDDPERALQAALLCTEMARLATDHEMRASGLARQATCLHELGRDAERFEPAIEEAEAWGRVGNYRKRANSLLTAFSMAPQQGDPRTAALHTEALAAVAGVGDTEAMEHLEYLGRYVEKDGDFAMSATDQRMALDNAWHVLTEAKDERRALELFSGILADDSDCHEAREGLGACYGLMAYDARDAGDLQEAIELGTRAIDESRSSGEEGGWTPRNTQTLARWLVLRGGDYGKLVLSGEDAAANLSAAVSDLQEALRIGRDPETREQAQRLLNACSLVATAHDVPDPARFDPPGWYADPLGRHEHRFWNGSTWTGHVSNAGSTSFDAGGLDGR